MPALRPRLELPRLEHGTTALNPPIIPPARPPKSSIPSASPTTDLYGPTASLSLSLSLTESDSRRILLYLQSYIGGCYGSQAAVFGRIGGSLEVNITTLPERHICANHHAISIVKSWRGIARFRSRNATLRLDDWPKSNGNLFSTGFTVKPTAAAAERTLWLATKF